MGKGNKSKTNIVNIDVNFAGEREIPHRFKWTCGRSLYIKKDPTFVGELTDWYFHLETNCYPSKSSMKQPIFWRSLKARDTSAAKGMTCK